MKFSIDGFYGFGLFTYGNKAYVSDALVLQLIDLEYQIMVKAKSLAFKSQRQYKAETFLMSQAALAQ